MTAEEIRKIALDSAGNYCKYLETYDKGTQIVDVFEVEYLQSKDLLIKLRLAAKLFDTDSIFFHLLTKNKKYDTSQVKIIEYDTDKNVLLIKISDEITADFQKVDKQNLKVISDLKFLVQRVKAWYELNGTALQLPSKLSNLKDKISGIKFLNEFEPSENQRQSLSSIFTNPFTYVWGAPGTGKTQFVLAYAVMHYINNGKKVAILAPTNNAIEQVLRGVIKMTDKAEIDRKKILRLGIPSRKFAEEFPEVCEEKGIQKKLDELDKQISIIERLIALGNKQNIVKKANKILLLFNDIDKLESNVLSSKSVLESSKKDEKRIEIDIKYIDEDIEKNMIKKQKLLKRNSSFSHRIIKAFASKNTKDELEVNSMELLIVEKRKEKDLSIFSLEQAVSKKAIDERKYQKDELTFLNFLSELMLMITEMPILNKISSTLDPSNWKEIKNEIRNAIEKETKELEIDNQLINDYSLPELQEKYNQCIASRSKLAISSTQERIVSANVIACTLDGYIGRYTETKLSVEHIFLDEAGYANIIKALTLFNQDIPITFLGDHMQLPPVCEINDLEIKEKTEFKNMFLWAQSAIYLDILFSQTRDNALSQYLSNASWISNSLVKTSLNLTFRFGSNLASILSHYVYSEEFTSGNTNGETKIFFIDAKKIEGPKSRISITEVEAIERFTTKLKDNNSNDFVILTPYKKQVRLLGDHLPQERNDLKILTVHGSQGREWDTVILSVVDTNDKWFVDTTNPLSKGLNLVNTAVSRARKQLVIVCDRQFWKNQSGQLITDLINDGEELTI